MPSRLCRAACLFLLALASGLPAAEPDQKSAKDQKQALELSAAEKKLLDLTNAERARARLAPLQASPELFAAARAHSARMARLKRLAHTQDGKGPGERIRAAGYAAWGWGENCALGQRNPAEAVRSWMASPGHRANLLGAFKDVGLAVVADEEGRLYFTQVFGTPRPR
jgi:uncharacterized protein YkwD